MNLYNFSEIMLLLFFGQRKLCYYKNTFPQRKGLGVFFFLCQNLMEVQVRTAPKCFQATHRCPGHGTSSSCYPSPIKWDANGSRVLAFLCLALVWFYFIWV